VALIKGMVEKKEVLKIEWNETDKERRKLILEQKHDLKGRKREKND
jgi:hypothetical protein